MVPKSGINFKIFLVEFKMGLDIKKGFIPYNKIFSFITVKELLAQN